MALRQTEALEGFDGTALYLEKYLVDAPKGVVIALHGYAEHCGRYQKFVQHLVGKGFSVYIYDARGHGKSPGLRAFVEDYTYHLDDLDLLYARVRDRHSEPLFLFGHSMGGGLALRFVETRRPRLNGAILSSPLIKLPDNTPKLLAMLSPLVGRIAPQLLTVPGPRNEDLANNQEVGKAFAADELCYHGKVYARTGAELLRMTHTIQKTLEDVHENFLVLTGADDKITDPAGARMLVEHAVSFDKKHIEYPKMAHEILNERDGDKVAAEICQWMKDRLETKAE